MELCSKEERVQEQQKKDTEMKQAVVDLHGRKRFGIKEEQVKKKSGEFYHFNLDPVTFDALRQASANLKAVGLSMSYSVIVRDALRLYSDFSGKIASDDEVAKRAYAFLRCMRGIE